MNLLIYLKNKPTIYENLLTYFLRFYRPVFNNIL